MRSCLIFRAAIGVLVCSWGYSTCRAAQRFTAGDSSPTAKWNLRADTWGAVEGLGRKLPTFREVGPPRRNRDVGIFYFIDNLPERKILDNRKILKKDPHAVIGPLNSLHWWAKPLFGYYANSDPFVLREHAAMLGDAGINTIIFDSTNGPTYFGVQKALFKTWIWMRAAGNPVPRFLPFCGYGAWNTDYKNIYSVGLAKSLWFYWQGKPLMLYVGKRSSLPSKLHKFFTLRHCWTWTGGKDRWSWNNTSSGNAWQGNESQYAWHTSPNNPEEMPVAVGGWASPSFGRSFHDGREPPPSRQNPGLGINFAEQWRHALKVNPAFVYITGWNEWTAVCYPARNPESFAGHLVPKGSPTFIDEYSPEYSRDVEPMYSDKGGLYGGFGDNYYYQMVGYIRRYKGVEPLRSITPRSIDIHGRFEQWKSVRPEFRNNIGLAVHRDSRGWGDKIYINNTGRNEIVASKCTYDAKNIYFWVQTAQPITSWKEANWMLLFIDADDNYKTGWLGYDYVIDRKVLSKDRAEIQKNIGGKYRWKTIGTIHYRRKGNQMMMTIPRKLLGVAGKLPAEINFKWADNILQTGSWRDFYLNGDCAPPFRFYYRAKFAPHS